MAEISCISQRAVAVDATPGATGLQATSAIPSRGAAAKRSELTPTFGSMVRMAQSPFVQAAAIDQANIQRLLSLQASLPHPGRQKLDLRQAAVSAAEPRLKLRASLSDKCSFSTGVPA